jgi:ubiquinone/menaquinone biosynthesis C-methylase UbiE
VLDVGCGTGWLTRRAADSVGPTGTAWGIDPAPNMIRVAMQTAGCRHCGARFKLAAVEALPFKEESFDVVVISLVLHHLPPEARTAGLSDVRRVLKSDGRLIVVDIDKPRSWFLRALLSPLRHNANLRDLASGHMKGVLEEAGFHLIKQVGNWGPFVGFWRAAKSREQGPTATV